MVRLSIILLLSCSVTLLLMISEVESNTNVPAYRRNNSGEAPSLLGARSGFFMRRAPGVDQEERSFPISTPSTQEYHQQQQPFFALSNDNNTNVFKIRGGGGGGGLHTTKRRRSTLRWILKVGVDVSVSYIILHLIITNFGPIQTITCINWTVFILWCLSRFFHHYILAAGTSSFLGGGGGGTTMSRIPIETVKVKRDQSFTYPSDKILIDCDNGCTLNQQWNIFDYRTSSIQIRYLLRRRKDTITLTFMTIDNFLDAFQKSHKKNKLTIIFSNLLPLLQKKNDGTIHHPLSSQWELSKKNVVGSETAKIRQGSTCNFDRDMILMNWNNGLSEDTYKKIFNPTLPRFVKKKLLQERSKTMTLQFVPVEEYGKTLMKIHKPKRSHPAAEFYNFMNHNFLTPDKWKELRKRPITIFGGAFSHMDATHILSNMAAFQAFGTVLVEKFGASKFTHLYLFCIVTSNLIAFWWDHFGPWYFHTTSSGGSHRLGASGAISGMIAATMCYYSKEGMGMQEKSIRILKNTMVRPHEALLFHILSDLAGLLRINELWKAFEYFLNDNLEAAIHHILRVEDKDEDHDSSTHESQRLIGYSSHLGGYLGGTLFHFLIHSESVSTVMSDLKESDAAHPSTYLKNLERLMKRAKHLMNDWKAYCDKFEQIVKGIQKFM